MRVPLLFLVLLAGWSGYAYASPSQFRWHREILLGDNQEKYFYLLITMSNAGTYYQDFESTFVCERSRESPGLLSKTMVRATTRSTNVDTGKTEFQETLGDSFDLFRYLSERNCKPAYFEMWPESVACDEHGLYFRDAGQRSYIEGEQSVQGWGMEPARGSVVDHLETRTYGTNGGENPIVYFVVRSGEMDDGGQSSVIIPVRRLKLQAAMEDVRQRVLTREPGTLKR